MSRQLALRWVSGGEEGSAATTLDALAAFFGRYLVLGHPELAGLLATWALGTWIYRAFRIFPYLSIRSPERRCGTSTSASSVGA